MIYPVNYPEDALMASNNLSLDEVILHLRGGLSSSKFGDDSLMRRAADLLDMQKTSLWALGEQITEAISHTPRPVEGEVVSRAVSDDAIAHLRIRSPLNNAIYAAVRGYVMSNMADADDHACGYPLVDLMSNPAPADIGTGEIEMVYLTDEIEAAVRDALARPVEAGAGKLAEENTRYREALERIAKDRFGVRHDRLWEVSLERRDIARAALTTPAGGIAEGGR